MSTCGFGVIFSLAHYYKFMKYIHAGPAQVAGKAIPGIGVSKPTSPPNLLQLPLSLFPNNIPSNLGELNVECELKSNPRTNPIIPKEWKIRLPTRNITKGNTIVQIARRVEN